MTLLALTKTQTAGGHIALATVLAIVGIFLLLPRPRGRVVGGGIAALITSSVVLLTWFYTAFGDPMPDLIGTVLFWLFSAGALTFGTMLVAQKNPARGAIAFAIAILCVCGLFLLLAAPFLMAATIIIYAGAIIVTFLFVLMLSHADGPSDENDRSREPLYGSFAGIAFIGLVLFTLYQTSQANAHAGSTKVESQLPAQVITAEERKTLAGAISKLEEVEKQLDEIGSLPSNRQRSEAFEAAYGPVKADLESVVGAGREGSGPLNNGSLRGRLEKQPHPGETTRLVRDDPQARAVIARAISIRAANHQTNQQAENLFLTSKPNEKADVTALKAQIRKLREEVLILHGTGDLPADNVRNLGLVLYSEHLLAIELAGTLLLVAVIGAIAIAHRKREGATATGAVALKGVAK